MLQQSTMFMFCSMRAHNKRLKKRCLRPLDSQQVARRLGLRYALEERSCF